MTDLIARPDSPSDNPDLVATDTKVGNNSYRAGTIVPDRPHDDSLRPKDRVQHAVPPNSLLWKYMGALSTLLVTGQRGAILETMWPQLGQGVSDHSVLVTRGDFRALQERAANTFKTIGGVLYGTPEHATTYGVQVRNFHKSIKGEMPNGRRYHALDSETFYWAHVTFFELIYRTSELGVFALSQEEKEQIFEESKFWFSLYGVDDRAQPITYAQFEEYLDDVKANQLIDSGIARYTTGSAKTPDYFVRMATPRVRPAMRLMAPAIAAMLRITTMGHMEPELLERLKLTEYWTAKDQRRYRLLLTVLRHAHKVGAKYRLPLKYRYAPFAVEAFQREGIHPDDITLESARKALSEAKAANNVRLGDSRLLSAVLTPAPEGGICAKCERTLEDCEECGATGLVDGESCDVCNGAQRGCPVHHAEWTTPAVAH
ncbi:oxygenase MpaB family protein [Mycobacterium sp. PDNC021]|uniref:oxygenase MpaB family protein n=1 Tax=Mycobacterium sp. PDNC021 TaxID=3391399 RepID=UPI003AAB95ED